MQIGLGVLSLPPESFWHLSVREWSCALEGLMAARGVGAGVPLTRAELEDMIRRFVPPAEDTNGN